MLTVTAQSTFLVMYQGSSM